jgi:hypothetical protein
MKRVLVRVLDDRGRESFFVTDDMPDEEAEELRDRVEKEHAEAGETNRWIRVGSHSIQSRQIQTISIQEPLSADLHHDEGGTFFHRDMKF